VFNIYLPITMSVIISKYLLKRNIVKNEKLFIIYWVWRRRKGRDAVCSTNYCLCSAIQITPRPCFTPVNHTAIFLKAFCQLTVLIWRCLFFGLTPLGLLPCFTLTPYLWRENNSWFRPIFSGTQLGCKTGAGCNSAVWHQDINSDCSAKS
jgi:hypothetical protein